MIYWPYDIGEVGETRGMEDIWRKTGPGEASADVGAVGKIGEEAFDEKTQSEQSSQNVRVDGFARSSLGCLVYDKSTAP